MMLSLNPQPVKVILPLRIWLIRNATVCPLLAVKANRMTVMCKRQLSGHWYKKIHEMLQLKTCKVAWSVVYVRTSISLTAAIAAVMHSKCMSRLSG